MYHGFTWVKIGSICRIPQSRTEEEKVGREEVVIEHDILQFVTHFGYIGLFGILMFGIIGVPVPDELLLAYVGFLVSKGQLHYFWAVAAGALGSLTGMSVSFFAGYKLGKPFVEKWGRKIHLTPARVDRVEQWFERFGSWTVTLGYFIPGFRHLTAITAGVSRWNYGSFSLYALAGAIIWVFFFISTGVYFGEHWSHYLVRFNHWIKWGAFAVLIIVLIVGITRVKLFKKNPKYEE